MRGLPEAPHLSRRQQACVRIVSGSVSQPIPASASATVARSHSDASPAQIRWAGPRLGAHNDLVYDRLGLTEADRRALRERGVI